MNLIGLVVIGVVVVGVLMVIGIYNNLVRLRQSVRQGVADIDAQLRQRHDLIPNLVETVKGYAGHESATLEAVIAARNAAASGQPDSGSEQQLRGALDNLLALGEAYPDLKANTGFLELQKSLETIEGEIQMSRRYYNGSARDLNVKVESLPSTLSPKAEKCS